MVRGAYTGRLHPGRTSSRIDDSPRSSPALRAQSGVGGVGPSPLSAVAEGAATTTASREAEHTPSSAPLVRIHSECYTGETAWSARCDCGEQLDEAARLMSLSPTGGAVVYLRQEGRGIGLGEKLKAYNLQDLGNDTVQANLLLRHPADARSYGLATAILLDLGLTEVRLLTNNPDKIAAVEGPKKEVKVKERVPMVPLAWRGLKGGVTGKEVGEYLKTKVGRFSLPLSLSVSLSLLGSGWGIRLTVYANWTLCCRLHKWATFCQCRMICSSRFSPLCFCLSCSLPVPSHSASGWRAGFLLYHFGYPWGVSLA